MKPLTLDLASCIVKELKSSGESDSKGKGDDPLVLPKYSSFHARSRGLKSKVKWSPETEFLALMASRCLIREVVRKGRIALVHPLTRMAEVAQAVLGSFSNEVLRNRLKRCNVGLGLSCLLRRIPQTHSFYILAERLDQFEDDVRTVVESVVISPVFIQRLCKVVVEQHERCFGSLDRFLDCHLNAPCKETEEQYMKAAVHFATLHQSTLDCCRRIATQDTNDLTIQDRRTALTTLEVFLDARAELCLLEITEQDINSMDDTLEDLAQRKLDPLFRSNNSSPTKSSSNMQDVTSLVSSVLEQKQENAGATTARSRKKRKLQGESVRNGSHSVASSASYLSRSTNQSSGIRTAKSKEISASLQFPSLPHSLVVSQAPNYVHSVPLLPLQASGRILVANPSYAGMQAPNRAYADMPTTTSTSAHSVNGIQEGQRQAFQQRPRGYDEAVYMQHMMANAANFAQNAFYGNNEQVQQPLQGQGNFAPEASWKARVAGHELPLSYRSEPSCQTMSMPSNGVAQQPFLNAFVNNGLFSPPAQRMFASQIFSPGMNRPLNQSLQVGEAPHPSFPRDPLGSSNERAQSVFQSNASFN